MDSKNYAEVLIDGSVYTLAGSEEKSYFQKVAAYINDKIEQMRSQPGFTKQSDNYQTVMVELNMADDYFKAVDRLGVMERQKADMEREMYSLKHELVSTQMKLEAALRSLEELQRSQLEAFTKERAESKENTDAVVQTALEQPEPVSAVPEDLTESAAPEPEVHTENAEERVKREQEERDAAVAAAVNAAHNAGFIPPASHIPYSNKGGHGTRKGKR